MLSNVKAQIRKEFINSMLEKSKVSKLGKTDKEKRVDLQSRIALSSAYHLLKKRGYKHSLSVFAAEAGLEGKNGILSEIDIVRGLNIAEDSEIFTEIASEFGRDNNKENAPATATRKSVFDLVVENLYRMSTNNTQEGHSM